MNVEFVNPFLDAILNVLSTMAMTEAQPGRPTLKKGHMALGEITGMIGLAGGQVKGSLAITFTGPAIIHIATQMLGEEIKTVDDTVRDLVGEITNMVSGGAKKVLAEKGYKFEMAIPTTITGKDHTITHKTSGHVIVVPFNLGDDKGEFYVEVCVQD